MAKVTEYKQRLDALRETKMKHTQEKWEVIGVMDFDDHGRILPPPEFREVLEYRGPSGNVIRDVRLSNFKPISNHPSGGFFGPKAVGENFRRFMDAHPVYIDPLSSISGAWMGWLPAYVNPGWNPDFDYSYLEDEHMKYGIATAILGGQHFCQDLLIGFKLGWGGLLEKVRRYRKVNPQAADFYDGLEDVILGTQDWIRRHVDAAREMAKTEENPELRKNLEEMAEINQRLMTEPPRTFREVCQWIAWYQMIARMYNGSGSMGQIDEWLRPYYEREVAAGALTDEEAIFHIACLFLNDTQYYQLGGSDASGRDLTSKVSFLILEAAHRLKTPVNIGIRVHDGLDPQLLRRGIEIMFEDKTAFPKFLGDKNASTPVVTGSLFLAASTH
ncbi:MAG: hypothetical protein CVU38_01760 [Chloroflexi bacterium HGW-Chloroflexi-1]|nr:MAG: hypothetical protein CVU38_01760 [Chloroflexi bacterium HGW-Chloroflexi-1]